MWVKAAMQYVVDFSYSLIDFFSLSTCVFPLNIPRWCLTFLNCQTDWECTNLLVLTWRSDSFAICRVCVYSDWIINENFRQLEIECCCWMSNISNQSAGRKWMNERLTLAMQFAVVVYRSQVKRVRRHQQQLRSVQVFLFMLKICCGEL